MDFSVDLTHPQQSTRPFEVDPGEPTKDKLWEAKGGKEDTCHLWESTAIRIGYSEAACLGTAGQDARQPKPRRRRQRSGNRQDKPIQEVTGETSDDDSRNPREIPQQPYRDLAQGTRVSSGDLNNLNSYSPSRAQSAVKDKIIDGKYTDSGSLNISDANRQGAVLVESKCSQSCLERMAATDAKIDNMSTRLDQIMALLQAQGRNEGDRVSLEQTIPKKTFSSSVERDSQGAD